MAGKQEKGKQGFASMDEEQVKETASKGGKSGGKGSDTESKSSSQASAEADEDAGEELDELLGAFEEGDLAAIDLEEASELIDEWQETLSKSKDADLKAIGSSLKQLKKSLSGGKAKPEAIAELMTQLAEQTDSYANNAERGYKTKMHNLGRAFKRAAKSLEQGEE